MMPKLLKSVEFEWSKIHIPNKITNVLPNAMYVQQLYHPSVVELQPAANAEYYVVCIWAAN